MNESQALVDDMKRMPQFKLILIYLALLPGSFIGFATAWALLAPSFLYYCWDDAPPFLIAWYPPFIHPWVDSLDGKLHDFYRVPEGLVYTVWLTFVAGVLTVPAVVVWRFVSRGGASPDHQSAAANCRRAGQSDNQSAMGAARVPGGRV